MLWEAGADPLLLATFSSLDELELAVRAARETCDLPVVASMTYAPDGLTLSGQSPVEVTARLRGARRWPGWDTPSLDGLLDMMRGGQAAIIGTPEEVVAPTAEKSAVEGEGARLRVAAAEERPSWLAVLDDRSPDPEVCPFLRSTDGRGLIAPMERADPANRCAALTEAVPQSLRQQELVCLTTGHINCPRYLRGAAVLLETPPAVVRQGRSMSPAMLGSLVVLVMALTASVAFVLARGGAMGIGPTGSAGASAPVALVSPSAASVAPASPSSIAEVTPTPVPTPSPTPTPTATPAIASPTKVDTTDLTTENDVRGSSGAWPLKYPS